MAASLSLTISPSPLAPGEFYIIEATKSLSPGIRAPKDSDFRIIGTFDSESEFPLSLTSAYSAIFGTPRPGMRIFVRASTVKLGKGFLSVPVVRSVIVT